ncbi:MAG: DNA pilot protein [Microvirus sp.]|nr:MAG: DNA pilot protein [Microvirus sp.]
MGDDQGVNIDSTAGNAIQGYAMGGPYGAAISAGASILGGLMSNESNAKTAERNNQFNAQQAQINREFQERMSSTAHQRETADLKAAGLNPILSGTGGMGAGTPAGSTGTANNWTATDVLSPAVSSAKQGGMAAAELQNIQSDSALKLDQATQARSTGALADVQGQVAETQGLLNIANAEKSRLDGLYAASMTLPVEQRAQFLGEQITKMRAETKQLGAQTQLTGAQQSLVGQQTRTSAADAFLMGKQAELTGHSARSAAVEANINEIPGVRIGERAAAAGKDVSDAVRNFIPKFQTSKPPFSRGRR